MEDPKGARLVPGHRPDATAPKDYACVSHSSRHPMSRLGPGLPLVSGAPADARSRPARRARLGEFDPSVSRRGTHRPSPEPGRYVGRCRRSMVDGSPASRRRSVRTPIPVSSASMDCVTLQDSRNCAKRDPISVSICRDVFIWPSKASYGL